LTRVDGMTNRLVALAGLCVSGYLAFMVVAILNVEHLGTEEYVIHIGRSVTIIATYSWWPDAHWRWFRHLARI